MKRGIKTILTHTPKKVTENNEHVCMYVKEEWMEKCENENDEIVCSF